MLKKYVLIGLLVLIIVLVFSISFIALSPSKTTKPTPTPIISSPQTFPTPTTVALIKKSLPQENTAFTSLSFSPNPLTVSTPISSLDVVINTGKNNITGVQLELTFDPKILTNVQINPVPDNEAFLKNAMVLLKNIDEKNGRISFALAVTPDQQPPQGTGKIATITFSLLDKTAQSTQINFLPKTLVTASGISTSVLKSSEDGNILLK